MAASTAIDAASKVAGVAGGAAANQMVFNGAVDPSDATKDAVEDLLHPAVGEAVPKHVGLRSVPLIVPAR